MSSDLVSFLSRNFENLSQEERRLAMEALLESRGTTPAFGQNVEKTITTLKERAESFARKEELHVGDLVTWKEGLRNRKRPAEGEPAIVMEILDGPVFDPEKSGGSAYFREPLDIVLGLLDEDADFALFHFDSRRFQRLGTSTD